MRDPSSSALSTQHSALFPTLGWAVFLGMSWTWCIGMFLPVLMVRDFGLWGWVVFAVPNVVGAAAMGWVLRDASSSARLTTNHGVACSAFSAVTIIFQISFVGWVVQALIGQAGALIAVGSAVMAGLLWKSRPATWAGAAAVFIISIIGFAMAPRYVADLPMAGFPAPSAFTTNLGALACVIVFGFLLCPYLDLTFHRARQESSRRAGAAAFTVGFGGPFLLMIVFTLWYARLLAPLTAGRTPVMSGALRWIIAVHMSMQCGYTIGVHWRAIGWGRNIAAHPDKMRGGLLGFAVAMLPLVASRFAVPYVHHIATSQELIYRLFLAFYGLVFPAYVWLCMMPARGAAPNRRQIRLLMFAIVAAAPMYWKGFVDNEMIWLVPGVGLVLVARLPLVWQPRSADRSIARADD